MQELLLNQQRIVLRVLTVVALFVPVSSVKWETSSGYPYSDDRGIFGSLHLFFEDDAEDFDSLQVHPNVLRTLFAREDALESRLRTEVAASIEEVRADPSNVISSEDMYTFLSGLKGKYHTKQAS